ncbi:uncharacterized protein LOC135710792 [Ochlerotatus camptorhynchus]|uniref:uncharacterized protein LOC135710792 n=1 Tax=Ochlerotatus camptorhynchus TaxID=644619 RepID=UPI0031E48BC5
MGGKPENSRSSGGGGLLVYVGNIPKAATEDQLRKFFHECKGIVDFSFRLDDCTYCPTKIAFMKFSNRHDESKAYRLNQTFFQGKRIFVTSVDSDRNFTPRYAVMVKQLNEYVTEEDVYDHFKNIGAIECVQKPAINYAYVSFERSESTQRALAIKNRNLKGVDIEVFPVKRNISMIMEKPTLLTYADIRDKCDALGLRYEPESETQTKLLVTNIPRSVPEEEVLEYLSKFGKVVDWEMQKSPISVLTNIGFVTYMNPKTARFVYLYAPHNFQGVALDIYNPRIAYGEVKSTTSVLLKRTNVYLTNDEIYQAMNECGRVAYIHRVDSMRYCTIVRFKFSIAVSQALKIKRLADENVYVTKYSEQSYLTDMSAIPEAVPKSSLRLQKESMLRKMIEKEDLAELARLRTVPNAKYICPNTEFYRNEVQIMNHPAGSGLIQLREYFKKCGNVINFREVVKGGYIREGFLSFDTRLEARRACTMNQNFMNGKRLLIHMANESLFLDPELCVMVMGLNALVLDEDIYDRFSDIGNVKFVHRHSPGIACVCMEQKRWLEPALRVILINKHQVIVSRVNSMNLAGSSGGPHMQQFMQQQTNSKLSYHPTVVIKDVPRPNLRPIELGRPNVQGPRPMDQGGPRPMGPGMGPMGGPKGPMMGPGGPMMGPGGPMMGPGGPMMGPGGPMMGPGGPMMGPGGPMMGPGGPMMGPGGPMMGPGGPMMGPGGPMMGPGGPMMGPGGPMMGPGGAMMGPGGPMMGPGGPMMGPGGPINQNPPIVTPAMRRLMQMIESQMINIQTFSSLPMIEQFRLVHGVVNQFIQVPQFVDMKPDDKIRFLISGQHGFAYANTFTLFTYPQQLQLLALIQQDYWNTINSTPVPTIMQGSAPDQIMQSDPVAVNPDPPSLQEEEIPDPMDGEDIVAPWQIKSSNPPPPTKTTPDRSIYNTIPLSAQDRFEKAEKLRLEVELNDSKNSDKVLTVSSDSDSDCIPPAPEPPQFSSKKSCSISPLTLPPRLSRIRSLSPVDHYRRSRSRSISRRRLSRSPDSRSPRKRNSLSPFSKALLSSPLLRYDQSASNSPERYRQNPSPPLRTAYRPDTSSRDKERQRSRSRSPIPSYRSRSRSPYRPRYTSPSRSTRHRRHHQRSRSRSRSRSVGRRSVRKSRSKSESPLSLSPPRKSPSPKMWDDPTLAKQPPRYTFNLDTISGSTNSLFVGNLPLDTTEEQMLEIFGKYGQIVSFKFATQNIGTKRAYLRFDTYDQALKALDMHLKQYRGHLVRVAFMNKRQKERPGYSIIVQVARKHYDEIVIYNTFKLCGDISYFWTRFSNTTAGKIARVYGVIDFKHRDAVRAARETYKLVNGKRCTVAAIM